MRARKQQLAAAPAPRRTTRAAPETLTSGYALVVDRQMKGEFKTHDAARHRAESLKRRFPALQVQIFDAEKKHFERVELTEA
ncbi:hypothetical protein [Bradyrhizobium sp. Tv2a-2]|uniref:hypothetical protein n=1 Tax=Bradyrhizobium sp. Tv2a-2 TaxID=113395 RepID=UPI00040FCE58|nr:hypothetical protein [Bradyrhizobium sp. Tv2a-2]